MKKVLILLCFISLLLGCSYIDDNKSKNELDLIKNSIPQLLEEEAKQHMENITLIADTIKVLEITEIENRTYAFGIYKFKDKTKGSISKNNNLSYGLYFREVTKSSSDNRYQVKGGFTAEGDCDPKAPFFGGGNGQVLCGVIQNNGLSKIEVLYSDKKAITYEVYGKDHYLIFTKDNPDLKIVRASFYNKADKLISKID